MRDQLEDAASAPPRSTNGVPRRRKIESPTAAELVRANTELQRANDRLERANAELWRENTRLARATLGQSDAAAAAQLLRAERELRPQLGEAEARIDQLERLLATPRHRAVEHARERLTRVPAAYAVVRWSWRLLSRAAPRGG